jgi:predicted membrane channel-forming protein YqfA (hemolysin III family)
MNSYTVTVLTIGNCGITYQVKAKDSKEAAKLGEMIALDAGWLSVRVVSVCQI